MPRPGRPPPDLTRRGRRLERLQLVDALDQRRFVSGRIDRHPGSNIFSIVVDATDNGLWIELATHNQIRTGRIYEDVGPDDGQRVLVDRIWPRGIRKDDPRVGIWFKDVAPSKSLREWYHHRPELFYEFAARYEAELAGSAALEDLRQFTRAGRRHPGDRDSRG